MFMKKGVYLRNAGKTFFAISGGLLMFMFFFLIYQGQSGLLNSPPAKGTQVMVLACPEEVPYEVNGIGKVKHVVDIDNPGTDELLERDKRNCENVDINGDGPGSYGARRVLQEAKDKAIAECEKKVAPGFKCADNPDDPCTKKILPPICTIVSESITYYSAWNYDDYSGNDPYHDEYGCPLGQYCCYATAEAEAKGTWDLQCVNEGKDNT